MHINHRGQHRNFRWLQRVSECAACIFLLTIQAFSGTSSAETLSNSAFRVTAADEEGRVAIHVEDVTANREVAQGPYYYLAVKEDNPAKQYGLENATISAGGDRIIIRGRLAGLDMEQTLSLPKDQPVLEEHILLHNNSPSAVALKEFETGFTLRVTDAAGQILPEMAGDHWAAVPFLRRAEDPKGVVYDFPLRALLDQPGFEYIPHVFIFPVETKRVACPHRFSEGWAWMRGDRSLGVFTFNQEQMAFATVTPHDSPSGKLLRFGGSCLLNSTLSALRSIAPGQSVDLGRTRYQSIEGGYNETAYAFRVMLDEKGCRFPADYNPPINWEQYFDMEGCWQDRPHKYTLALLEKEADKGNEFNCEALYLDPGWDTDFGTFIWGPWLGSQEHFIEEMQLKHGLKVGFHFPLPPWSGEPCNLPSMGIAMRGISAWPESCRRQLVKGATAAIPNDQPWICMGSKQYLDEAERRILKCCEAGAVFLMFDGNWWNGPCVDERHGHPIPYRYEDHMRACLDLARRVHARYPKVLIEMHDMLAGGEWKRMTPVYYKYGLPGSYDENWGFELMWTPMKNLKSGIADALYYYGLACNVPIYLHINLEGDNEHATALWWYASTCRHLGIGGKAKDQAIVKVHEEAMSQYKKWEAFYKRGEFYGIRKEIHLHVLPSQKAFVVNVFNLSDEKRTISGSIDLKTLGLDPSAPFTSTDGPGRVESGRYQVNIELPPWGAKVAEFRAF